MSKTVQGRQAPGKNFSITQNLLITTNNINNDISGH
jgi:hypothetical protein